MYRVGLKTGTIYGDEFSIEQISECCYVEESYSEAVDLSSRMPDPMCSGCPRFVDCGKENENGN